MFECDKCGKKFNKKHHLEYHVGRRRPCINIQNIYQDGLEHNKKGMADEPNAIIGLAESYPKLSIHKNTKENGFKCNKYVNIYKYSSTLARHKKTH